MIAVLSRMCSFVLHASCKQESANFCLSRDAASLLTDSSFDRVLLCKFSAFGHNTANIETANIMFLLIIVHGWCFSQWKVNDESITRDSISRQNQNHLHETISKNNSLFRTASNNAIANPGLVCNYPYCGVSQQVCCIAATSRLPPSHSHVS